MRLPSQRTGATLAAVSAAVLILSMFADWYRLDLPSQVQGRAIDVPTYNAFEALERTDVYLVVAAVVALLVAGLLLASVWSESPAPALVLGVASLFALALVLYRGTSSPKFVVFGVQVDTTLRLGWFIALLAAAAMVCGAVLAYLGGPRVQVNSDASDTDRQTGVEASPSGQEPRKTEG
jgi:hypothetical protein